MKKIISLLLALALCLTLAACGGVDERYLPLIESLEVHDYETAVQIVMGMRQEAIDNGDIVIVEPQEEDYDLVNRYLDIANFLMNYKPFSYNSIYNSETKEDLKDSEALNYCYAQLQELEAVDQWLDSEYFSFEEGFPTDRAALLSRFTNIGKKLAYVKYTTVDNMSNESVDTAFKYFYDENGTLMVEYLSWNTISQKWEGLLSLNGYYRYTYNDAGVITETRITDWNNENVSAVVTPTYDEAGKLVSEKIVTNDNEYDAVYTYDAGGKLSRMHLTRLNSNTEYEVLYTYDEAGRLIQKDRYSFSYGNYGRTDDSHRIYTYTYDAAGNMVSQSYIYQDLSLRYSNNVRESYVFAESQNSATYTYDANGNLVQEAWQYGETVYEDGRTEKPDYVTRTIDYIYEDYYLFN